MSQAHALEALIEALRRLPGVGVKSASRMAFHLLQHDREGAVSLSRALSHAVERIGHCERCHTFSEQAVCTTCLDPGRDASRLCVVETPADQSALERTSMPLDTLAEALLEDTEGRMGLPSYPSVEVSE